MPTGVVGHVGAVVCMVSGSVRTLSLAAVLPGTLSSQISCQADSDATKRRACAAASCPIASTASASGGALPRDVVQHRSRGAGADAAAARSGSARRGCT